MGLDQAGGRLPARRAPVGPDVEHVGAARRDRGRGGDREVDGVAEDRRFASGGFPVGGVRIPEIDSLAWGDDLLVAPVTREGRATAFTNTS